METAYEINEDRLLHHLTSTKVSDICGNHLEFYEWNNETDDLIAKLKKIGQISIQPSEKQWEAQYWGQDAKILMDCYPNYGCDIFQCTKCNTTFFYYLELGGHGAQKRYRVVRKELIDLETIRPKHQIIIDYKYMDYVVYKNPDLTYSISICKSLGIGVDIFHQLSNEEKEHYLQNGIISLTERMKDMDKNYDNYKVTSWR
jgi:hypothetical protein